MDALTMIKERRSVRKFKDEKIDRELVNEIIGLANYSPTWGHSQEIRYTVLDDAATIEKLAVEGMNGFTHNVNIVKGAPAVAILSVVKGKSGRSPKGEFISNKGDSWEMFDAGCAAQTLSLAAHAKGLGSVILGVFDAEKVAEIIDLPCNEVVEAIIPFGIPAINPNTPPRKALDEILRFK